MNANGWSTGTPDVSSDDPFTLVSDRHRRSVLAELASHQSPVTLLDLAGALSPPGIGATDVYERVVTRLHHVDLPKLDDFGVITYDPDRQLVWYDADPAAIEATLDDVERALDSIRSLC